MQTSSETRPFALENCFLRGLWTWFGGRRSIFVLHEELAYQHIIGLADMPGWTMVSARLCLGETAPWVVELPGNEQAQVEGDDANGDPCNLFVVHSFMPLSAFNRNRTL